MDKAEIKKVKILETNYDKDKDIVKWFIRELETNREITLAWKASDLGTALGIKNEIPSDLMEDFCKKMRNKEINLIMKPDSQLLGKDLKNEDKMKSFHSNFDKYPYQEVIEETTKESLKKKGIDQNG